jgi:MoaD family protein
MIVRYFAHLRDNAGCAEEFVSVPASVLDLLRSLADRHQEPLKSSILSQDGKEPHPDIFILVNGRHLRQLQGLETELADTDVVAIIPVTEAG